MRTGKRGKSSVASWMDSYPPGHDISIFMNNCHFVELYRGNNADKYMCNHKKIEFVRSSLLT